jgi:uncharacterized membrane protein HdeD (DUF308 family)
MNEKTADISDTSQTDTTSPAALVFGEARKKWGWLLALGILFFILGIIGLGMSVSLTLVSVLFFGWLVIIGGAFQLVEAFKVKGWKGILWHLLLGVVYLFAGGIIVYDPVGGAIALTMFIAAALIAAGVLRIILAFQLKGEPGWWWPLVGGLLSVVLGVLIMAGWPSTALWIIGMFIAIEMISNGWSYIMIALIAKRTAKAEEEAQATAATT